MPNRLPPFLLKRVPKQQNIRSVRELIGDIRVRTVCEEAKCPNIGECFARRACTFMVLGDICTRSCAFCGVHHGQPAAADPAEPERIARSAQKLGLNYVVITSVTRDDLADGGAEHFAKVIRKLRMTNYELRIEVLIPDLKGERQALQTVIEAGPDVLNHNIETVPRLYSEIRPQADYRRSLNVLSGAKAIAPRVYTKSGFMVGLGETKEEIDSVLADLKAVDCDLVTIGQYLPPSKAHRPPVRYVTPAEFMEFEQKGTALGLSKVFAGPFVRSSYHAGELIK